MDPQLPLQRRLLRYSLRNARHHSQALSRMDLQSQSWNTLGDGSQVRSNETADGRGARPFLEGRERTAEPSQAFGMVSPWHAAVNLKAMFVYGADFSSAWRVVASSVFLTLPLSRARSPSDRSRSRTGCFWGSHCVLGFTRLLRWRARESFDYSGEFRSVG
jgi:hypothetical protein